MRQLHVQATGISTSLKLFIEKLPDVKYLALSTADGLELSGGQESNLFYFLFTFATKEC